MELGDGVVGSSHLPASSSSSSSSSSPVDPTQAALGVVDLLSQRVSVTTEMVAEAVSIEVVTEMVETEMVVTEMAAAVSTVSTALSLATSSLKLLLRESESA